MRFPSITSTSISTVFPPSSTFKLLRIRYGVYVRPKNDFNVVIISRKYKKKKKGYALADETSTALDIGDEPMQFHLKFPEITMAVGEERMVAIPQLLHDRPDTKAIILDDAFQHRSVTAGLNILLTDYNNLFTRKWFFTTSNLKAKKRSYKRSQLFIFIKYRNQTSAKSGDFFFFH